MDHIYECGCCDVLLNLEMNNVLVTSKCTCGHIYTTIKQKVRVQRGYHGWYSIIFMGHYVEERGRECVYYRINLFVSYGEVSRGRGCRMEREILRETTHYRNWL